MSLSIEQIASVKPGEKPVKVFDGLGLFLLCHPSGGRWWRFKYRFAGRSNAVALGVYPAVSIDEARALRDRYRAMLAEGINPSDHIRAKRAGRLSEPAHLGPAPRFLLGSDASLSFQLESGRLTLTPEETAELRDFLHATRAVIRR